jgi:hypothetical protein
LIETVVALRFPFHIILVTLVGVDIATGRCRVVERPHVSNRTKLHYILLEVYVEHG